jgi:hypothetical protein
MAGGSYSGGTVNNDSSKTSASDVVFRPAPGASVTVTSELQIYGDHLELRDLDLAGGWKALPGADDITFRNVHHQHFFIWSASNVSLIGGDVGTDGTRVDYDSQITEYSGSRVAPRDILIDGVHFHDWIDVDPGQANHIECLQVGAGVNVTIRNSRFEECGTHDIFIRSWGGINGGVHELKGWLIENNFFGKTLNGYYAIQFVNDLGYSTADFVVRNNSFLQAIYIEPGTKTNVTVDSNILSEQASYNCGGDVYRYNVIESGSKCGSTDRVAAVQYVNRAALDLHLRPGSAGIGHGNPSGYPGTDIDGEARPRGGTPDAGADESG